MSQKPDNVIKLSDTLSLSEFTNGGAKGFWLYDTTRGRNLSMRAETERAAFLEALEYYQQKTSDLETQFGNLQTKVDNFVGLIRPTEDKDWDY